MSAAEWLDRADALTAAATEGPWVRFYTHVGGLNLIGPGPEWHATLITAGLADDAEFIAASRTMLPQAVAALRAVLHLHSPIFVRGDDVHVCRACGSVLDDKSPNCATVDAIFGALS